MTLRLLAAYRLLDYEKRFLEAEVRALGGRVLRKGRTWETDLDEASARRLTYASGFRNGDPSVTRTHQALAEGVGRRQSTRYGPHALHEYRGKFNPQTPRSLMLQSRFEGKDTVLDPFCGSGTTLVEARLLGLRSVGIELHPLAFFVSIAKQDWLQRPDAAVPTRNELLKCSPVQWAPDAGRYLANWFPERQLVGIARIMGWTGTCGPSDRRVAQAILSDLLREHSLQDPRDLRIRRRADVPEALDIVAGFLERLRRTWADRERWHAEGLAPKADNATILLGSAARASHLLDAGSIAGTVTSPPYATALPYSDTYRLSNVVLGLVEVDGLPALERELAGSREIMKEDRVLFPARLGGLPEGIAATLQDLLQAVSDDRTAGFRKRALPYALARYWSVMAKVLDELLVVERASAANLWVVGPNQTTISGRKIALDTPGMLAALAKEKGFVGVAREPLDAYGRFDLHSANSIRSESLVRFKAPR